MLLCDFGIQIEVGNCEINSHFAHAKGREYELGNISIRQRQAKVVIKCEIIHVEIINHEMNSRENERQFEFEQYEYKTNI